MTNIFLMIKYFSTVPSAYDGNWKNKAIQPSIHLVNNSMSESLYSAPDLKYNYARGQIIQKRRKIVHGQIKRGCWNHARKLFFWKSPEL
jgi:hypothetical protein